MTNLLYFLIGLFSATIGAISGIGGGIIIKPALDATKSMSISSISFISGCTVLAMAVTSLLRGRNSDVKIDMAKSTPLAIGGALGGIFGKSIFDTSKVLFNNDNLLGAVQSATMLLIAVLVLLYMVYSNKIKTLDVVNPCICCAIGLFLGVISAFLGIGGGPLNIAVLYYFFSMDTKVAAKNSIYVILFSQTTSLIVTIMTRNIPTFDYTVVIVMALSGMIGGTLGSAISKRISSKIVEKIFTAVLFMIMFINSYNFIGFMRS